MRGMKCCADMACRCLGRIIILRGRRRCRCFVRYGGFFVLLLHCCFGFSTDLCYKGKQRVTSSMRVAIIIMGSFPSFWWSSIVFRHRLAYYDDTNDDCGTKNFKGKTTYGCLLGAPLTFCFPRHPTGRSLLHLAAMRWYYL